MSNSPAIARLLDTTITDDATRIRLAGAGAWQPLPGPGRFFVISGDAHHLVDLHRLRGGRWVTVTVEGTSLDALMVEELGQRVAVRVAEGIGSDILWQLDDESIRLIDTTPRIVAKVPRTRAPPGDEHPATHLSSG